MGRQRFYTIYANDEEEFSKVKLNIYIIYKKNRNLIKEII